MTATTYRAVALPPTPPSPRFLRRARALFAACPERPGLCEDCRRVAALVGART